MNSSAPRRANAAARPTASVWPRVTTKSTQNPAVHASGMRHGIGPQKISRGTRTAGPAPGGEGRGCASGPRPPARSPDPAGRAADAVAHARCGGDDRRVAEFAPQAADGHRDGVGERVGVLVPDLFEQVLGAEEGGAGAQERFEDGELLDRQVERLPVAGDRAPQRIELDPVRAQVPARRGRAGAGPGSGCAARARGSGTAWRDSRRRPGPGRPTRSPGEQAAVSMSTMTRPSCSVIIWQRVSPWMPGRSRSRTTTS